MADQSARQLTQALIRNGLWILLFGLLSATGSELVRRLVH